MEYLGDSAITLKDFIFQMNNDFSHPVFKFLMT